MKDKDNVRNVEVLLGCDEPRTLSEVIEYNKEILCDFFAGRNSNLVEISNSIETGHRVETYLKTPEDLYKVRLNFYGFEFIEEKIKKGEWAVSFAIEHVEACVLSLYKFDRNSIRSLEYKLVLDVKKRTLTFKGKTVILPSML